MRKHLSVIILVLLVSLFLVGLQTHTALTLPDRLSDADFWQMVTAFSESDGYFISDNYVSNELSYQSVIPELRKRTRPGGVYLGVAPEQNFTYIAALQPKMAFIIDIRRQNLLELLMYKALFEISDNRADFVTRLFSRPSPGGLDGSSTADDLFRRRPTAPNSALYRTTLEAIDKNLRAKHGFKLTDEDVRRIAGIFTTFGQTGPAINYNTGGHTRVQNIPDYYDLMVATDKQHYNWSYLETEERFRYLKGLEERNLIVPVVGDFSGPRALHSVGDYVRAHHATVTVFYISNVEDYLRYGWENYRRNIASLPSDRSSLFIRFIARQSVIDPMSSVPPDWPGARGNGPPHRP